MIGKPEESRNVVAIEDWRRLYSAATRVREMEPWKWMEEGDLFGVKVPGHDSVAFVSVMGMLGEYHAIAVYPNPIELHRFWGLDITQGKRSLGDQLLDITCLHASFGSANQLDPKDKGIIKELGLKFRGFNAWPGFRSYRPGWFPWFLEAQEVHLMTVALEQLLEIAPRIQKDPSILVLAGNSDSLLVREPANDTPGADWRDSRCEFPAKPMHLRLRVPMLLVDEVRSLTQSEQGLELDLFPAQLPIGGKGERPQSPYGLILVDSDSSFVLGMELVPVTDSLEEMWETIPAHVLKMLKKNKVRPSVIAIRAPHVGMIMDGICNALGIGLEHMDELTALDEARDFMEQWSFEAP